MPVRIGSAVAPISLKGRLITQRILRSGLHGHPSDFRIRSAAVRCERVDRNELRPALVPSEGCMSIVSSEGEESILPRVKAEDAVSWDRRRLLRTAAGVLGATTLEFAADRTASLAAGGLQASPRSEDSVVVPLFYCGGSYCMTFNIDNHGPFRAVVDTGSPFFTVAGSCTKRSPFPPSTSSPASSRFETEN
eukprot:3723355-Rhodomonas_salina.3